jgi:hypothetical protein
MPYAPPLPLPEPSGPLPAVPEHYSSMSVHEVRFYGTAGSVEQNQQVVESPRWQFLCARTVGGVPFVGSNSSSVRGMWSGYAAVPTSGGAIHARPPSYSFGSWCLTVLIGLLLLLLLVLPRLTGSSLASRRRPLRRSRTGGTLQAALLWHAWSPSWSR